MLVIGETCCLVIMLDLMLALVVLKADLVEVQEDVIQHLFLGDVKSVIWLTTPRPFFQRFNENLHAINSPQAHITHVHSFSA